MKIATWNVNGIRARQAQAAGVDRARAAGRRLSSGNQGRADQVPAALCEMEGYWCYWHGDKGLLGRRPARAQGILRRSARVSHTRPSTTRTGSSPPRLRADRRLDLRAQWRKGLRRRRCASSRRWTHSRPGLHAAGRAARPLRRSERRARGHRRAPEGAKAARDRPAARGARAPRAAPRAADWSTSAARSTRTTTRLFTWWAPWRNMRQRNIGWRLDYVLASQSVFDRVASCSVDRDFGTSDHAPVVARFDV